MLLPDGLPPREALAEAAARGAAILPQLRRLLLAEALATPPPRYALSLNAELETLCAALQQAVRRRAGWLYFAAPPTEEPLPAAIPRTLLQAAVLCFAREALHTHTRAVLALHADCRGTALLTLRTAGPLPPRSSLPPLLQRMAAITGGACVTTAPGAPFATAVRLPHSPAPLHEPPTANSYLYDRYSPLYAFLWKDCVPPE